MGIIDFRNRPLTQEWLQFLELPFQAVHAARARKGRGGKFEIQTTQDLVTEMDNAGITLGVVLGRDVETTLGWKWDNQRIVEMVDQFPDRFIGFVGVDPNKKMAAVREIDEFVKRGLKGVSLDPFLHRMRMHDKKVYPIYAKCAEYNIPVVLTTGLSPWGGDWEYMSYCNVMDLDEVATDFPDLVLIMAHSGFPWVWETLAICRRHPNVYIEISGIPTSYAALGGADPYVHAANEALSDQFLFGSAAPYYTLSFSVEVTHKLAFKKEVLGKILYDNAARILKI